MSGEGEHRDECENDDRHRKKNGATDLFAGDEGSLPSFVGSEFAAFVVLSLFAMAEHIFGDDDGSIYQHANGNGDAGK